MLKPFEEILARSRDIGIPPDLVNPTTGVLVPSLLSVGGSDVLTGFPGDHHHFSEEPTDPFNLRSKGTRRRRPDSETPQQVGASSNSPRLLAD